MLSLTCKTAIKAVIYLASKFETKQKSGIKEVAEFIGASEHTVGKLLQTLVKENVINSAKGPTGGFFIDAIQIEKPLLMVVEAIDGKEVFTQCGLGFVKCSAIHPCPIHNDYKKVRDLFESICIHNKISDLYEPVNKGLAYLIG
ncbi:MAG: Rrf2 family transcriptional regulator [Bacteroidia bacterium]|nr:Rrf2 family transcriptional regulator [Bacteroidia bacterium]